MVVYMIKNRVNRKVYIGQTICKLEQRWASHLSDAKRGAGRWGGIADAMRTLGVEAFEIKVIYEAKDQAELDRMEAWFVFLWNSHHPDCGYNLTLDGKFVNFREWNVMWERDRPRHPPDTLNRL